MNLHELIPDAQTLLDLEPEELGGCMLRVMNSDTSSRMATLDLWDHKLFGGRPSPYPNQYRSRMFRALAEAWGWLEAQGLIAWPDTANGRNGFRIPSRRGERIATAENFEFFRRSTELPRDQLHSRIVNKVPSLYLRGDYDVAVFQAFKEVEVAVRDGAGLEATLVGVQLMRTAFDPNGGPLSDQGVPQAEREALAHLFAGAIGRYKNPHSHRDVAVVDPAEAREMIMLASHLLRIVDAHRT